VNFLSSLVAGHGATPTRARLHKASGGLPRAHNTAIAARIAAAADGKALVDDESAKKAVAELNRDRD